MSLIDTHAHLEFKDFDNDREEVIKRAFDASVTKIITVGCDFLSHKKATDIAQKYNGVYACVGFHPDEVDRVGGNINGMEVDDYKSVQEKVKAHLSSALEESSKIVAIGECGLDYSRLKKGKEGDSKKKQEILFRAQIEYANEVKLPLIIHVRDAEDDAFTILKDYPETKGVLHCFGGSTEHAKQFLDMGFLISFTGIVTFKNADVVREVVKIVPLEKMMVETDCPFLAPEPHRGKRNEPAYVVEVARKIAEVKNVSFEQVSETTTKNAITFFNL
ncbi:TatD family hydrolase [Patescibacteria group bacterium]|nr:TatD family hydrolase [Patescibacteria group bacterium]